MSAIVIPLRQRKTPLRPHEKMSAIVTREILREYITFPTDAVERAIVAANEAIEKGGTFVDALEAANKAATCRHPDIEAERNFQRLMLFRRRRARLTDAMMQVAEVQIRIRMRRAPESAVQATIERARRILANGNDIGRAIQLALIEPEGAA
jgi:hypothetical protein